MKPEEMLEKLEPVLGQKAKKLYVAWMLADKDEKEELEQAIKLLYLKHFNPTPTKPPVLLAPPTQSVCIGEVPVGRVVYSDRELHDFSLREGELSQHVAVFGRTGSGKTNTVRNLLKAFLKRKLPFWVFDWKKDYSQLDYETVFAGIGIRNEDILVLPVGRRNVNCLRVNPLIPPPNTSPEEWAKQLCEILTHAYMGGPGFESIFLKAIDQCYRDRGIYQGSQDYPTFQDVKQQLETKRYSGREAMWMQSAMRTINSICFGGMNDTVNSQEQQSIQDLLKKNVILELDQLSNADKTFLIEVLLLWLHHYKLQNPPANKVEQVIVVEEAHHLLRYKDSDEETLIENCLREMRSLGIGIVIVDQMPSLISRVALANTFCTIALNVKTGQDVNALSQAMLLDADQKDILGSLGVGEAVVKLQDRYNKPFQLRIPLLPTEGLRMLHYKEAPATSGVPGIPEPSATRTASISVAGRVSPQMNKPSKAEGQNETSRPEQQPKVENPKYNAAKIGEPGKEVALLVDIADHPSDCVTVRYKRLGLSARGGNHYKDKLIRAGFITPVTFAGNGAWLRLFEITPAGIDRLKSLGHKIPSTRTGGLEHQYWTEQLSMHYQAQGYKVEREKNIRGHTVDLLATRGKERIAIEIETGKSNHIANAQACLANKDITTVVMACITRDVAERIMQDTTNLNDDRLIVDDVRRLLHQQKAHIEST